MRNIVVLWRRLKLETYTLLIFMNLALAVFAFFKDVAFAHYFGTSKTADAYTIGFFIPDMIGNNLVASALGVACIPIFSRLLVRGSKALLLSVVKWMALLILIITGILTWGLYLESQWVISWYGHNLTGTTKLETLHVYREMLPIVMLIPLTFIGVAFLQTEKKFLVPAVAPVIYHSLLFLLSIVLSILLIRVQKGGAIYSGATTIATFIYFLIVWSRVLKQWRSYHLNKRPSKFSNVSLYLRAIMKDFFPYLMILLFMQTLMFIERYYASGLESGTLAALNYAYRLVQFPIWVFVAAITTVLLPDFSREFTAKRPLAVMRKLVLTLLITGALTLIMSLGLFVFRHLIVSMLFQRGAFNAHSVSQTVTILTGYSFAIVGQSLSLICLRYFIASRKMGYPIIVYFLGMLTSVLIDYYAIPKIGAVALGYSGAIGSTLSGLLFLIGITREYYLCKTMARGVETI